MKQSRIEAFSDGVIAVIITIMVLELKAPKDASLAALEQVLPAMIVYAFSFLVVAIFWVNHHHLLRAAKSASPSLMWTNNNLLFWLSLVPFVTAYMGQNISSPLPVAAYGAVLAMGAVAYFLVQLVVTKQLVDDARRCAYYRRMNLKAIMGMFLYAASCALAFWDVRISYAIFVVIPLLYFVPDKQLAEMVE